MNPVKVTFVETSGSEVTLECTDPNQSLMEVGRNAGVKGILGTCGGGCSCATCHVYVNPQWMPVVGAPDDVEADLLAMYDDAVRDTSRLSCQIKIRSELDGLRVAVAPGDG